MSRLYAKLQQLPHAAVVVQLPFVLRDDLDRNVLKTQTKRSRKRSLK